jgi:aquaporin NIP
MNPARTVGPALVSGQYRSIWVYVVGPVVGAVAGAWAYNLIRFTNKPLREITKSTSFLKSTGRLNSSSSSS